MRLRKALFLLTAMLLPLSGFAATFGKNIHLYAEILSFLSTVLLITSLLSIKQFFFPGEKNMTPFQVFNIIFIVAFYTVSLSFLINNKDFYPGFEQLSGIDCVKKIFFEWDSSTIKQWVIIFALFINIAYIVKNGRDEHYAK